MDLVIARYNEDTNWISSIESYFSNIYIYNKGDHLKTKYIYNTLSNVGREANTYIHHIIRHYENLANFTIFVQGHPYDHFFIQSNTDPYEGFNYEIDQIFRIQESKTKIEINFFEINYNSEFTQIGNYLQSNFAHDELYNCLDQICDILNIQKIIKNDLKKNIWGAQFGVTNKKIRKYSRQQWEKLLVLSETIEEFPYAMEKFWSYIFF